MLPPLEEREELAEELEAEEREPELLAAELEDREALLLEAEAVPARLKELEPPRADCVWTLPAELARATTTSFDLALPGSRTVKARNL